MISAGVLAIGDIAKVSHTLNVARMAKRLTSKVMLYVDGSKELSEQIVTSLGGDDGIAVDERHIIRIEKVDKEISEVIFHFEDGSNIHHGFIVSTVLSLFLRDMLTSWNVFRLTSPNPRSMGHSWSN